MKNDRYPFVNTPLPYAYDALEPFIDEATMRFHHDRHLQTYIDHLNAALQKAPELQSMSLSEMLRHPERIPEDKRTAVRRNAGGVFNHRFFFEGMTPKGKKEPGRRLSEALEQAFGGVERFKQMFEAAAMSVFGSGYAWLAKRGDQPLLLITKNQDTPLPLGLHPLLCVDVWEHAYYLKHQNRREEYLKDWWAVVDWDEAERRWRDGDTD